MTKANAWLKKVLGAGGVAICGFALWSAPIQARELEGVSLPDQVEVNGKKLVLNGMGVRRATFLKVKVYVGGLYLETPTRDRDAVKSSTQLRRIEMVFLRDVSANQQRDNWADNIKRYCKEGCEALRAQMEKNPGLFSEMKKGETMVYLVAPENLELWVRGKKIAIVENPEFARILLSALLGPEPQDDGLAKGLLGG